MHNDTARTRSALSNPPVGRITPSAVPGLGVRRTVGASGYTVVHLASGLAIPRRCYHRREVQHLVAALAPLADWTLDLDALRGAPDRTRELATAIALIPSAPPVNSTRVTRTLPHSLEGIGR